MLALSPSLAFRACPPGAGTKQSLSLKTGTGTLPCPNLGKFVSPASVILGCQYRVHIQAGPCPALPCPVHAVLCLSSSAVRACMYRCTGLFMTSSKIKQSNPFHALRCYVCVTGCGIPMAQHSCWIKLSATSTSLSTHMMAHLTVHQMLSKPSNHACRVTPRCSVCLCIHTRSLLPCVSMCEQIGAVRQNSELQSVFTEHSLVFVQPQEKVTCVTSNDST